MGLTAWLAWVILAAGLVLNGLFVYLRTRKMAPTHLVALLLAALLPFLLGVCGLVSGAVEAAQHINADETMVARAVGSMLGSPLAGALVSMETVAAACILAWRNGLQTSGAQH